MRNPVRLKNLNVRFMPLYAVGLMVLVLFPPRREILAMTLPIVGLGAALRGWSAGHLVKSHELSVTGPYAHLRHPLYAGTILITTGFALGIGGWASPLVLVAVWSWFALHYLPRKERSESRRLEKLHGDRFTRYRAAVPALWPRWRSWADGHEMEGSTTLRGWDLDRYSDNNELGTLLAVCLAALLLWLKAADAA